MFGLATDPRLTTRRRCSLGLTQGSYVHVDTMPADRMASRACFMRRLVLSWSACYSAIMPVMIYSLWEVSSRAL